MSILPRPIRGLSENGCRGGFTLLELVIAVFLIAAAVAVSVPSLSRGRASLELQTTGRDMVNIMRYAREKAVTGLEEVRLILDREKQQVTLVTESGEGGRNMPLPRRVRFEQFALGSQDVPRGPLVIRFWPNGSAEEATIQLRNDNGSVLRVITDPITGVARVLRPGAE